MGATPAQYAEVKEYRAKILGVREQMKGVLAKARTEKREATGDEQSKFDELMNLYTTLSARVEKIEKMWDDENEEAETTEETKGMNEEERNLYLSRKRRGLEIRSHGLNVSLPGNNPVRGGLNNSSPAIARRAKPEYRQALGAFLLGRTTQHILQQHIEKRNVQMDVDAKGGVMVLPIEMSESILKKVDDLLPFQQKATRIPLSKAASLGVPTLETNMDNGDWTTEIAQINQDTGLSFGRRQLTPTPVRKRILVSERLLRLAFGVNYDSDDVAPVPTTGGSAQGLVEDRLAYTLARTKEIAFMTGNGVGQPLGAFTASTRGISTARDVLSATAGNIAGGFEWQKMIAGKMSLKVQYQDKAEWFLHRLALSKIMQLASTTNIPILVNSGIPATPPTLLERPYNLTENAPSTFSANAYVALFGDPRFYWIADSLEITVAVADQLYMETAQVGFFGSAESDGMPVLEEAFVRFVLPGS